MSNKPKRILSITSKSGKPLHISTIGLREIEKLNQERADALGGCTAGPYKPYVPEHEVAADLDLPEPAPSPIPVKAPAPKSKARITRMFTADQWTQMADVSLEQRQLCGPLWYEGEICILFADTNVGKSILAVQIADMIGRGQQCETSLPELRPQTLPQGVVYADFELSLTQFARRYSCPHPQDGERKVYYDFGPNFHRVELYYDLSAEGGGGDDEFAGKEFADQIIADLEARIAETGARVLIIDNITFMAAGTETAADAMPLMKKLVALKKRHDLSILLLAHTPKRSLSSPLTRNDLQGSKMLINFADSAFALGESTHGKDIRYIKQIKQRNCEQVYGTDSVLVCSLGKVYENFVGLRSVDTSPETDHLADDYRRGRQKRVQQQEETVGRCMEQGMTAADIIDSTGMSRRTVYRVMSRLRQG